MLRDRPQPFGREDAEGLAIAALGFLAADPDRLGRFISLSGVDPGAVRSAASDPGFLIGIMDFVLSDESLLMDFARDQGLPPDRIAIAHAKLTGTVR